MSFTIPVATTWVFGAFLLFAIACLVLMKISPDAVSDVVTTSTVIAAVLFFVTALLLGKYPGGDTLPRALGLRSLPLWQVLVAALVGATAQAPAEAVFRFTLRFFPIDPVEAAQHSEMLVGHSHVHSALLFLSIALLVPFAEEAFFRGAIFGALRRDSTGAVAASVFTSIAFTLFHPEPRSWPTVVGLAFLLGAFRARSGSLVATVALHVGFNSVTMVSSLTRYGKPLEEWLASGRNIALGTATWAVLVALFLVGCLGEGARQRRDLDGIPVHG